MTATGVIHCFEEGALAEKGVGGQPERGWKSVYLEPIGSTALKEWGPLAGGSDSM